MYFVRYTPDKQSHWDEFVSSCRNGTFLFYRDYMDYHRDRFDDHSLMLYDEKDNLLALFPANTAGKQLDSHGGLTYGGFVINDDMKTPKMVTAFDTLVQYAIEQKFETIRYKTVPHLYHHAPAEEDRYALYLCDAKLIDRAVITAVEMVNPLKFQSRRRRGAKSARKSGVTAQRSQDWRAYWDVLEALLANVHDSSPVHSYEEIMRLQQKFPENIKLYAAYNQDEVVAGIVIYETERVARCQYIAASVAGQNLGALDYLFTYVLQEVYADKPYVEFGTSQSSENTDYINIGLMNQKEGFGARAVMHDTYQIDLQAVNRKRLIEAIS